MLKKMNRSWIWLALATLLGMASAGAHTIALATWLSGIFGLRFLRLNPSWRGFLAYWLVGGLGAFVGVRGFVPLPDVALLPFMLFTSLTGLVPLLADRLLVRRLDGLTGTLVLPTALVAWNFLDAMLMNAYGSWGNPVYALIDDLAMSQSAAAVGIWGLIFLMGWTASLLNWAWERGFRLDAVRVGMGLYITVMLLAALGGGARLAFAAPAATTVPVAAVSQSSRMLLDSAPAAVLQKLFAGQALSADEADQLRAGMAPLADALFAESVRAARAGARIVAWPEGSLYLLPEHEPALAARLSETARAEGIYLQVAYAIFHSGALHENKAVIYGPDGALALSYLKSNLVPFSEDGLFVRGDGRLPTLDTPYGRIGLLICHDQDHHQFVAQAGAQGVDILLVPTGDWADIGVAHQSLGAMRAIEQGMSVVRVTHGGITGAIDPYGRVIASMDQRDVRFDGTPTDPARPSEVRALIARVPTAGLATPYRTIGDALAWVCVATLVGLTGLALLRRRARGLRPAAQNL